MIILFLLLLSAEPLVGEKRLKRVIALVEVPCGFSLRWINVLFCPAFVLMPLGPSISGLEVGKIIAVLILGYVAVFALTAYLTRGLQFLLGNSKRGVTERAEEMGVEDDEIPLTDMSNGVSASATQSESFLPLMPVPAAPAVQAPLRAQDPSKVTGTGGPPTEQPELTTSLAAPSLLRRDTAPITRAQRWAAEININMDLLLYSVIFFCVGMPVYYAAHYAMPIQLTVTILAYFAALSLPPLWRRFLHPAMVASIITIVALWILAQTYGDTIQDELKAYKTGTRYTHLFLGEENVPKPGAGDILSSVLDVSIVSLALPMFQYRQELKRTASLDLTIVLTTTDTEQFFTIIVPNVSIAVASFFLYPLVCHSIGISPSRSLSFPSRSLTLALAQPATQNLGGDLSLVAVLALLSGIMGVLLGPQMLKLLRIPEGTMQ